MKSAKRLVTAGLLLAIVGSAAFAFAYATDAGVLAQGLPVAVALGGLALALCTWSLQLLPQEQVVNKRDDYPSAPLERKAAEDLAETGAREIGRFSALERLLAIAAASLGIAALFPLRSLAPRSNPLPGETKWRNGSRLVREDGSAVLASDIAVGSMITVFPSGATHDQNSAVLLIHTHPWLLQSDPARASWSTNGYIAFSKICTHAGCPVGLYRPDSNQLLCPCHQSVFDVKHGATPIFGPAARPLPQLPIAIAPDGSLYATAGFQTPIGPAYWERA